MSGPMVDDLSTLSREPGVDGWLPLVELSALESAMPTPVPVRVGETRWALVVLDGAIAALHDVCPHRRVPLSAGAVAPGPDGSQVLECGYHGWSYDRQGACARIPALGENVVPRGMGSVAVMSTATSAGVVWGALADAPGELPAFGDAVFLREQLIDLDVPSIDRALRAASDPRGVRTGTDARGPLRYVVRPVGRGGAALFPVVPGADLAAGTAAWVERLADLPALSAPPAVNER